MNAFRRSAGRQSAWLLRAVAASSLAGVVAIVGCAKEKSSGAATEPAARATAVRLEGGETREAPTYRNDCAGCHARAHAVNLDHGPAASSRCAECHATVHDDIQGLYAGTSGPGAPLPDDMYEARVACTECHTPTALRARGTAGHEAALDAECTSCHGRAFGGMLGRWSAGLEWRARLVSSYVATAGADRRLTTNATARPRLAAARQALATVTSAGGEHNVRQSDALLRSAIDNAAAAYRAANADAPARPALGPDAARVECMGCHYGIETARGSVFGRPFDHGSHVLRGAVACTECHSGANYFLRDKPDIDRRHGRTMLTPASCDNCHHSAAMHVGCGACHASDGRLGQAMSVVLPLRLRSAGAPTTRTVAFEHADHTNESCTTCHSSAAVGTITACANCHDTHHREASSCTQCHGATLLAAHKADDHLACAQCHAVQTLRLLTPDRTFCVSCHADKAQHRPGKECSTCHMQSTPAELRQRILGPRR